MPEHTDQLTNIINSVFFEHHNFVMLLINPETGQIINANHKACSYYGYDKETLCSMQIQQINVLTDSEVYQGMQNTKAKKRNFYRFHHQLANGEIRTVEVYSTPIKIDNHILLHSIIFDTTETKTYDSLFNQLFKHSPLATVLIDNNHKIVNKNDCFLKLFKYESEEVNNQFFFDLIGNDAFNDDIQHSIHLISKGLIVQKTTKRLNKGNQEIDVEALSFPLIDNGEKIGNIIIYNDITQKVSYENNLKLFERVLSNNTEGIAITNSTQLVEWVNHAFTQIITLPSDKLLNKNILTILNESFQNINIDAIQSSLLNNEKWHAELVPYNKNSSSTIEIKMFLIKNVSNDISNYAIIINDISEKKIREKRIEYMAFRDTLTGLFNRTYLLQQLNTAIETNPNQRLAILFLDLDDFKNVNDTLGHSIGDQLLKQVSSRLLNTVNASSTVARIGGDEFVILLPNINHTNDSLTMGQKIVDALNKPFLIGHNEIYTATSIGVSIYPDDGQNNETLIKHADIAMYESKKNKNNDKKHVVLFKRMMDKPVNEEYELSNHLRRAIKRNELSIHYQPVVDIASDKVIGAEALLRWNDTKMGFIPPDKCIPIAEKTGLINPIGNWVLRTACRQNKRWQDAGYQPLRIAVNVSVIQLKQPDFPDTVKQILEETKLDPKYLELELTESFSAENIDNIRKVLEDLNHLGISISIDDFGTGYSSLKQLTHLSIAKLKIDKSFILNITDNLENHEMASAILAIAQHLNIKVVAEGIETLNQLSFLKDGKCDYGQGYLFSKPLDSESFEALMLK